MKKIFKTRKVSLFLLVIVGSPILIVVSIIYRDQCIYYLYNVIIYYLIYNYVINIQFCNTDNICTDLYISLKPQSELGCLRRNKTIHELCTCASTPLFIHHLFTPSFKLSKM